MWACEGGESTGKVTTRGLVWTNALGFSGITVWSSPFQNYIEVPGNQFAPFHHGHHGFYTSIGIIDRFPANYQGFTMSFDPKKSSMQDQQPPGPSGWLSAALFADLPWRAGAAGQGGIDWDLMGFI